MAFIATQKTDKLLLSTFQSWTSESKQIKPTIQWSKVGKAKKKPKKIFVSGYRANKTKNGEGKGVEVDKGFVLSLIHI